MRYVFLDVDGVLNSRYTTNDNGKIKGLAAIDYRNLAAFNTLMQELYKRYGKQDVKIILSSSWRIGSYRGKNTFRDMLNEELRKYRLFIHDITPDLPMGERGIEISTYLSGKLGILGGYLVLDDVFYTDYKPYITRHWVQTSYETLSGRGGFHEKHIKYALKMIEAPVKSDELNYLKQLYYRSKASAASSKYI